MTGAIGEPAGELHLAGDSGPEAPREVPACHDDVCITCSDTAVEVTVAWLLPDGLAVVDTQQGKEEVSVALVTARPGDRILVHAREAIAVIRRLPGTEQHSAGDITLRGGDSGGGDDGRG